ncbi:MAG: transposase [Terriglobales bacterium]
MYPYEYRRRLPHLQPDFKIIFVMFCTYLRWTLPPTARTIVVDTCLAGDGLKFNLWGLVVMPDHVHLAFTPIYLPQGPVPIAEIMQAIKGTSAHRINKLLSRRGRVWQEESFDRALRNEEHLTEKLYYMLGNPVRAALVVNPLDYPWLWRRTVPAFPVQINDVS